MQIRTIRNGLEAFECKFEQFERDSKRSNANLNHSEGIWSIWMEIRNIRMEIVSLQKGFEAFEC